MPEEKKIIKTEKLLVENEMDNRTKNWLREKEFCHLKQWQYYLNSFQRTIFGEFSEFCGCFLCEGVDFGQLKKS